MERPLSYTFNGVNVKKFINAIDDEETKKTVRILLNNTTHITYDIFLEQIQKHVPYLLEHVPDNRPIFVYIDVRDRIDNDYFYNKSNYWLFMLLKSFLPPNQDISVIKSLNSSKIKDNDIILFIDDCIYSGIQMSNSIRNLENVDNKSLKFMIYVPYVSKAGIELVKQAFIDNEQLKSCELFELEDYKMITPFGCFITENQAMELAKYYIHLKVDDILNAYPIYFDHKVAKHVSSFPNIYAGIIPNEWNKEGILTILTNDVKLENLNTELEDLQQNDIQIRLQWRFDTLHQLNPSFDRLDATLPPTKLVTQFNSMLQKNKTLPLSNASKIRELITQISLILIESMNQEQHQEKITLIRKLREEKIIKIKNDIRELKKEHKMTIKKLQIIPILNNCENNIGKISLYESFCPVPPYKVSNTSTNSFDTRSFLPKSLPSRLSRPSQSLSKLHNSI